jgi:hypothetical protein
MKYLFLALGVVFAWAGFSMQAAVWQPSFGHAQVPIWPEAAPDQSVTGEETFATTGKESLVAGKPWMYIEHVSQPTMTVYPAAGKNTGAAVVVFPGGGYQILAIDLEAQRSATGLPRKASPACCSSIACRATSNIPNQVRILNHPWLLKTRSAP